jgi:hypothetical protein
VDLNIFYYTSSKGAAARRIALSNDIFMKKNRKYFHKCFLYISSPTRSESETESGSPDARTAKLNCSKNFLQHEILSITQFPKDQQTLLHTMKKNVPLQKKHTQLRFRRGRRQPRPTKNSNGFSSPSPNDLNQSHRSFKVSFMQFGL